jgi:hypothetical protein
VHVPPELGGQSGAVRDAIHAAMGDTVLVVEARPSTGAGRRDSVRLSRMDAQRLARRLGRGRATVHSLRRMGAALDPVDPVEPPTTAPEPGARAGGMHAARRAGGRARHSLRLSHALRS